MKSIIAIYFFTASILLAGDAAMNLALYANVVCSKELDLPADLWKRTENLIASDDSKIWESINQHLFILKPIEGVFDLAPQKDCIQLKLLAIAKKPRNPNAAANDQVFDVVLWFPWLKTISSSGRAMSEVETFTGIAELKRQGAYPVPAPGRKHWIIVALVPCAVFLVFRLLKKAK